MARGHSRAVAFLRDGTGTLCSETALSPADHVRDSFMWLYPLSVLLSPIIENEQWCSRKHFLRDVLCFYFACLTLAAICLHHRNKISFPWKKVSLSARGRKWGMDDNSDVQLQVKLIKSQNIHYRSKVLGSVGFYCILFKEINTVN